MFLCEREVRKTWSTEVHSRNLESGDVTPAAAHDDETGLVYYGYKGTIAWRWGGG